MECSPFFSFLSKSSVIRLPEITSIEIPMQVFTVFSDFRNETYGFSPLISVPR
jgi:hypothetical protein